VILEFGINEAGPFQYLPSQDAFESLGPVLEDVAAMLMRTPALSAAGVGIFGVSSLFVQEAKA
jgi:hypothetical protein